MEAARKDSEAGKVYPATSAPLLAASFLIDAHCGQLNDMYMACRQQQEAPFSDPRPCFPSGVMLEVCVDDLFGRIRNSCQETFERYWRCLDMNNQMFMYCREEEQALQACTRDRLGLAKRLWKGSSPNDGYKEPDDLPAANVPQYRFHVWRYKNGVPDSK